MFFSCCFFFEIRLLHLRVAEHGVFKSKFVATKVYGEGMDVLEAVFKLEGLWDMLGGYLPPKSQNDKQDAGTPEPGGAATPHFSAHV